MKQNMSICAVILMVALLGLSGLATAEPPAETAQKPILVKGDVERLIKTYPLLKNDLDKLGMKYDGKGDMMLPDAIKANAEFKGILQKHGWDDQFFQKITVITAGYASLVIIEKLGENNPEIKEAIKTIDENPDIPKETKDQLKKDLLAGMDAMQKEGHAMSKQIHPQDLELIRPFIKDLKILFEYHD